MHLLTALFSKGRGGIEQCFLDYNAALVRAGCKVTALMHARSHLDTQARMEAKKEGYALATIGGTRRINPLIGRRLRRMMAHVQPDVVLTHGSRAFTLLRPACRTRSVPLVATVHNAWIKRLQGADGYVAVNRSLQAQLVEASYAQAGLVCYQPNMVRGVGEVSLPNRPTTWQVPVRLGFLGRLVRDKGADLLLQAVATLREQGVAMALHIAGEGKEQRRLKDQARALGIEAQVTWYGWVEEPEDFLRQIDLLVVPSRRESFGLVILQAWKQGVPVVASSADGPRSLITHGSSGLLFPPEDSAALARALKALIADPSYAGRLAQGGMAALPAYDLEEGGQQLRTFLERFGA